MSRDVLELTKLQHQQARAEVERLEAALSARKASDLAFDDLEAQLRVARPLEQRLLSEVERLEKWFQ